MAPIPTRLKRLAVSLSIGGALGFAAARLWPHEVSFLLLPVFLIVSAAAGVVLHEAGHLVAGIAVRFRPTLVIVGPVRLRRLPSGWKLEFGRLGFLGGAAVSMPSDEKRLVQRLKVYIAGGAASNLVCAGVAGLLASPTRPGVLLGVFSFVSFCFAVMALLPVETAGVLTDGARVRLLRRGGPDTDRWTACIYLISLSFRGIRPSVWPAEWIQQAVGHSDISPDDFQAAMIGYAVALDGGDLRSAREYLDRARMSLGVTAVIARPEYYIEKAFMAAVEGDVRTADAMLAQVDGGMIRQASLLRARAARERAAGKPAEAARLAKLGLAAAPNDWDAGMSSIDVHWLQQYESATEPGSIT